MKVPLIAGAGALIVGALLYMFFTSSGPKPEYLPGSEEPKVGAVAGPDIMSPYFSYGGVRHWGARTESLQQATTTVCAIQSPAATSTLITAAVRFDVSSTSAMFVELGKGTTQFATTSSLGYTQLGANANGIIVASTTPTTNLFSDRTQFGPNQWFLVKVNPASPGHISPSGVCQATWQSV